MNIFPFLKPRVVINFQHYREYVKNKYSILMMDLSELEECVKTAKLNSITDVIAFIVDHLHKTINFDPIHELHLLLQDLHLHTQELQTRLTEVERPKGLDRVMIEQVKTLIEAMLQQKEDRFKRDIEKTMQSGVSLHEPNTRRIGLEFLDNYHLGSGQHSKKQSQSGIGLDSCHCQPKLQAQTTREDANRAKELSEMGEKVKQMQEAIVKTQQKMERLRKQQQAYRVEINRELVSKMPIEETERLVEKFQKQVFGKMNEKLAKVERLEYQLRKSVIDEVALVRKDLHCAGLGNIENNSNDKGCGNSNDKGCSMTNKNGGRQQKEERRYKKLNRVCLKNEEQLGANRNELAQFKTQIKDSFEQVFQLIESLPATQSKLQPHPQNTLQSDPQTILKPEANISGTWMSASKNKVNPKTMSICWEQQVTNTHPLALKFEPNKSQILLVHPGYYMLDVCVYGCLSPPLLVLNSETVVCKMEAKQANRAPLMAIKNGSSSMVFGCSEIVRMVHSEKGGLLSIRFEGEEAVYSSAIIRVTKIA